MRWCANRRTVADVIKNTLLPSLLLSPVAFWTHVPFKWQQMVLPKAWCSPNPTNFTDIVRKAAVSSLSVTALVIMVGTVTWPRAHYAWMNEAAHSETECALLSATSCDVFDSKVSQPRLQCTNSFVAVNR